MLVKICGTTNLEDALLAVEAGADAVGFVFAPSKRKVTAEQVAEITRALPKHMEKVGVFTEPDPDAIGRAVLVAGLTVVQMHWRYNFYRVLDVRRAVGPATQLWQLIGYELEPAEPWRRPEESFGVVLAAVLQDRELDAVLLDAVKNGNSGGMGQVFPWEKAAEQLQEVRERAEKRVAWRSRAFPPVVLAGGLTPENVREATRILRPMGVDVVSGVEAAPGKKDPERLRRFVEAATGAAPDGTASLDDVDPLTGKAER